MNLRVRVLHCVCAGNRHWYADIDDADDPQPDDPFWYVDNCRSQTDALAIACGQLRSLSTSATLTRVQEAHLVRG
jgi:hypothetical protein